MRHFLVTIGNELSSDAFGFFLYLGFETSTVEAIAALHIAKKVRLVVAALFTALAGFLCVKRCALQKRASVHDDAFQIFRTFPGGIFKVLAHIFRVAHRQHFSVAQIDAAGCEVFHRLVAKLGDAAAAFRPACGLAKHGSDFRAALALCKEFCYGVRLIDGGHVLAHNVFSRGEFVSGTIADLRQHLTGNILESKFLAGTQAAGTCNHFVTAIFPAYGDWLQKTAHADACLEVVNALDAGARVVRIFPDFVERDFFQALFHSDFLFVVPLFKLLYNLFVLVKELLSGELYAFSVAIYPACPDASAFRQDAEHQKLQVRVGPVVHDSPRYSLCFIMSSLTALTASSVIVVLMPESHPQVSTTDLLAPRPQISILSIRPLSMKMLTT